MHFKLTLWLHPNQKQTLKIKLYCVKTCMLLRKDEIEHLPNLLTLLTLLLMLADPVHEQHQMGNS